MNPADNSTQSYWYHYTVIGVPSGVRKGVYLSIARINGDTADNVASYKLSDNYSTVQKINLISEGYSNAYARYLSLDNVVASIAETGKPYIADDDGATVEGDEDSGYVITASSGVDNVVVRLPDGVSASDVTVKVPADAQTVTPNGANVRVVRGESDITDYLDIPAAADGVVNIAAASVKDELVKETLDTDQGAEIELSPDKVQLKTAPTRAGLVYQLKEGETLEAMANCNTGDSTVGDGNPWEPEITVRGEESGFYTISVDK